MEGRVRDAEILDFLRNATFLSDEEGYEWAVYGEEADTPAKANRVAGRARDTIIRMHHLVMESMGSLHGRGGPSPGTSEGRRREPPNVPLGSDPRS
jgi:hypothetical protein